MSRVSETRADLISKVKAVLGAGVTVSKWAGEGKAMEAERPAVFVQWAGGLSAESIEIGSVTYPLDLVFLLYVLTEDDRDGEAGDDQAAMIKHGRGADGPHGTRDSSAWGGKAVQTPGRALRVPAESGSGKIDLYAQGWRVEQLVE